MGKILGIVLGITFLVVGLLLLINWWYEFLFILRGIIPAVFIFGGVIALIAGLNELKDALKTKK